MSIGYPSKIPTHFLRCLVDAKNPKSFEGPTGTTWFDISGYGNNFTLNNVAYDTGGWFSFNGTTSTAIMSPSTPNSFTFDNASSTVSVWFRPTSNQGNTNKAIITDDFGPEVGIWYDGTNVRSYAYAATNSVGATAVNDWVNVTMVVPYAARPGDAGSGSTGVYRVRQYINGKLSGSDTSSTVGNGLNDWPITLGYDFQSGTPIGYFTGDIGFVAIWQTALNDADIMRVYNVLRGRA